MGYLSKIWFLTFCVFANSAPATSLQPSPKGAVIVPVAPRSESIANQDYVNSSCNLYSRRLQGPVFVYCRAIDKSKSIARYSCEPKVDSPSTWTCQSEGVLKGNLDLVGGNKNQVSVSMSGSFRRSKLCRNVCQQTKFTRKES